jgi:hypothetical protein
LGSTCKYKVHVYTYVVNITVHKITVHNTLKKNKSFSYN